jgi:eukaryotic-like serine/threonine-protein kinase
MTGSNIGPYHIVEKLGEGVMGAVYKAEDTRLKRLVAIERLLLRGSQDREQDRLGFLQVA